MKICNSMYANFSLRYKIIFYLRKLLDISFWNDNVRRHELQRTSLSSRASAVRTDVHSNALCGNGSDFWNLRHFLIDRRSK
jgi:hypothetical protein